MEHTEEGLAKRGFLERGMGVSPMKGLGSDSGTIVFMGETPMLRSFASPSEV